MDINESIPQIPNQRLLDFIKEQTYGTMIAPPFSSQYEMQKGIITAMMRHIEPLLMTMGYLDAHAVALHNNTATHLAPIRDEMLDLTPDTLMSDFIPRLKIRLRRLSIQFNIGDIPGVQVLWQPLMLDPATGELCVDSSFNDKLIEANAQITEAILALNRLRYEHAPSPPSVRSFDPASHYPFMVASVSPSGAVTASELFQPREPVVAVSPEHVPVYVDDAASAVASAVVELESPPTSPMEVGLAQIIHRRSYAVLIHGRLLSSTWFEYPIEPNLGNVSYTAECACQTAPSVTREIRLGGVGTIKLSGSEFVREDPNHHKDIIFGRTGEPCPRGQGWVGLNPMLFACDAPEELDPNRALLEPQIGIWAFDAVDDAITGRRNVIDISQLKRLYNTDRSYGTYRLLFRLMKQDLNANPIHPECQINVVFHVCRTGKPHDLADITNKCVIFDKNDASFMGRARPLYKYPNEAHIVLVSQLQPDYVMEMIGFNVPNPNADMRPLGSRDVQNGLHFVFQGCFYNLMVYLGIISPDGGEVLTSIQNEGITSRMFLNFVGSINKHRSFVGLRHFNPVTSPFVVERLPIVLIEPDIQLVPTNGISKLLHVMLGISSKYIAIMQQGGRPPVHALLVKLFHRRGDELVHAEEVGHWVSFTIHPEDLNVAHLYAPWRFVDPQGLSTQTVIRSGTKYSYTVPMSFKPLRTLNEMCSTLNEFVEKFSHIDLFYIALPPGEVPHSFTLSLAEVTHSGIPLPNGGKTKKRLNKRKTKTKTKSKSKSKSKHDKRSSNRSSNRSSKRSKA